jgi:hypothetical protein
MLSLCPCICLSVSGLEDSRQSQSCFRQMKAEIFIQALENIYIPSHVLMNFYNYL